jgi:hypothetical protein
VSYCRWSSDYFRCDLYVYEHVYGGWTIHVAGSRIVWPEPPPEAPELPAGVTAESPELKAYMAWYRGFMDAVAVADRKLLNLPHDGETFSLETPGECADKIEELIGLGYNAPQYAIERLRAEQAEMDAEAPT